MGVKAGLVGLPNVGKSTLFNALTSANVPAQNYPFCTIDPHLAITIVPDERVEKLQKIYNSKETIPATVTFVDIAGLVKGAASGEGLGNQFLSHIKEVDLIIHVLRCFENPDIINTSASVDPLEDYQIITQELILKDLESITKRIPKVEMSYKKANNAAEKKVLEEEKALLITLQKALDQGDLQTAKNALAASTVATVPLLSTKKFLIVANIDEQELDNNAYTNNKYFQSLITTFGAQNVIPISAKIESELSELSAQEAQEMMGMMGMAEKGTLKIIQKTYQLLDLISFFTCGPKEIHVWPIKKGTTIRQAAGEIHSDLERGFICADVFNCNDLFAAGSESKVKEAGKGRTEGQGYLVTDGDIVNIKFNV